MECQAVQAICIRYSNYSMNKNAIYYFLYNFQLFGRAGHGGCQSRAHFCYSTKQIKVNPQVKIFSESTQNCLRQQLVSAVGSMESVSKGLYSVLRIHE